MFERWCISVKKQNRRLHRRYMLLFVLLFILMLTSGRIFWGEVVSISDNGEEMEEKMLPHIFNHFYRADYSEADEAGTGLGLAIVKEIIHRHSRKI